MRGPLALGVAAWLLSAAPARADPLALAWSAPEGCPREEAVRAQIDELLGGPPAEGVEPVAVNAVVARRGERWSLTLTTTTRGTTGERRMENDSCEALAKSAALIVALAVDPQAVAAHRSQQAGDDAAAAAGPAGAPLDFETPPPTPLELAIRHDEPPPPPASRPPPRPTPTSPSKRDELGLRFGLGLRGDLGSLPNPGFGLGGDAAWALPLGGGWRLAPRLSGTIYLPQRETVTEGAEVGGAFDFFTVALLGCPGADPGTVQLGVCLGVEMGRMSGEGFGVDNPARRDVVWSAFRFDLSAAWRFAAPFALRLDLGIAAPFGRPEWRLDGIGEIDRPSAIAGRIAFGPELQL